MGGVSPGWYGWWGMASGDVELLEAWRAGDRGAGDRLTRQYYAAVHRFFALRAADVADDLTQRTFLACSQGREPIAVSVRAYLFGIARKMLLKHLDARSREDDAAFDFDTPAAPSYFSPSRIVNVRQEYWLLLRALDNLALDAQQLIALFYVEELRAREIGEVLGMSTTAVTTRLSRARDALRAELAQLPAPPNVRAAVLDDLDAWARSLGSVLGELPSAV